VRYDGIIKTYPQLIKFIEKKFSIIAVCPEVETGLSTPRPAVQLHGSLQDIKILGRDNPAVDITRSMQAFCEQRPPQLNSIQGYIFKSRSPSCGIKDIPLFNTAGKTIGKTQGVFVSAMLQHYPNLPITDESGLETPEQCEQFFRKVKQYQKNNYAKSRL